ncbi:hypothetical protein [Aeromonas rivipollensis]|uniref:hypothetical protein n=1 Tax=Aeromonas rivipollensis TaxID=948519 RepID=UPI0027D95B96|nr:hypothetical protein [uncultured Aeromonas sp.]MDU1145232.1 hypothetical protein [Aeromonas hydrophila]
MADYINKNILSQAYIHIESEVVKNEQQLEEFKQLITEFARSRVDFFLSPDAPIEVDFEEGSLIARITILGTIGLLFQGIANYKDFREGIQLIYSDAKRVTDYIISEGVFSAGSRQQNVIRLEARVGIIGSIQKVINQLEGIKSDANGRKLATDLVEKLIESNKDIEKLISNLAAESDVELVKKGFLEIVDEMPEEPQPPKNKINEVAAANSYRNQKKKLRIRLISPANKPIQ